MAHVTADSSSSSVAEQLSVRLGQEYRVKLGRSFTFPEQNSFHTIKYDFKPQSVDSTKPGHLKVTDDEVDVSLPVVGQGDSVEDFTHFRGNKKPCMKECILIINTRTGEAILEKISNNVNLKAVRDGRKPAPVNRDRSVSPSPFMMQSKGHQAAKAQLSTGAHRHLTPSPIPTSTPPTSSSSTPSQSKGGGAAGTTTGAGNSTKKGQKKQTAKSKTPKAMTSTPAITAAVKQETGMTGKTGNNRKPKAKKKSDNSGSKQVIPAAPKIKTEPTQGNTALSSTTHLAPSQSMMSSMPVFGMELNREISPIQSANPTPEPILPPSTKKPKLTSSENSSSSSSDSSDSDSEREEPLSNAPPTQTQAPPHFSSVPVTRVPAAVSVGSHSQPVGSNMPVFSSSVMPGVAQKSHIAKKSQPIQQVSTGVVSQPRMATPQQQATLSSASSSESDSDSSSGSSSSDSSSDSSDEENDKEVAALNRGQDVQAERSYKRSFSELKTDLQLSSDSGSSSD